MTNLPFNGLFKVTNIKDSNHPGVDLVGLTNKTVYGVCNGTVRTIKYLKSSYGTHVTVRDNDTNKIFIFAHLASVNKNIKVGSKITRTTKIGVMGNTGNSTGPHLHLELRDNNFSKDSSYNEKLIQYLKIPNKIGIYNSSDYQIDLIPKIKYLAHCQNLGWQEEKTSGEMAGLYGNGLRIEAIIINAEINIKYRVHMENLGWGEWVPNGCMAGTIGESRAIEAIEIQSSKNVIIGEAYIENIGYQNKKKGTQIIIGTTGKGLRLEGFKLEFV